MSRVLLKLFVFSLGLVLAAVVAFREQLISEARSVLRSERSIASSTSGLNREDASETPPTELGVAEIARQKLELPYANEKRAMLSRNYSRERRVGILQNAIETGSLDSLQVVRSEYISFLPEYKDELLPQLKKSVMDTLRLRFSETDWLDWPSSNIAHKGGPTEARVFVDNLSLLNDDLGRFAETAAQLMHGMYLSILSGNRYSLKDDLFFVIQGAEKILSARTFVAIPARLMLDPAILSDPGFALSIESLRCDLTALHLRRYPEEFSAHLILIQDLKVDACSPATRDAVAEVLRRLTLETSTAFRKEILPKVIETATLVQLAQKNTQVKNNLAEFYVMSAVDALEQRETERAQGLLNLSTDIYKGLRSQGIVREHLARILARPESGTENQPSDKEKGAGEEGGGSLFGDSLRQTVVEKGTSYLGSFIVYATLLLGGGAMLAYLVLWQLGRRTLVRPPRRERSEIEGPAVQTRASSTVEDDDFRLDVDGDHLTTLDSIPSI
jgi:hypothetical protein